MHLHARKLINFFGNVTSADPKTTVNIALNQKEIAIMLAAQRLLLG
jgi:hypothetical protein